jgi:hypothetical protein
MRDAAVAGQRSCLECSTKFLCLPLKEDTGAAGVAQPSRGIEATQQKSLGALQVSCDAADDCLRGEPNFVLRPNSSAWHVQTGSVFGDYTLDSSVRQGLHPFQSFGDRGRLWTQCQSRWDISEQSNEPFATLPQWVRHQLHAVGVLEDVKDDKVGGQVAYQLWQATPRCDPLLQQREVGAVADRVPHDDLTVHNWLSGQREVEGAGNVREVPREDASGP